MREVTVVEKPPQLVIGMRKRGSFAEMPGMLMSLYQYAIAEGTQVTGPPLYICHEKCKEEIEKADAAGNADIEVAFPVATWIPDTETFKCFELAGGKMASIIHQGPYNQCEPAYEKLFAWIEENNYKITGLVREVYLNDPRQVPPEEILTEILAEVDHK